MLTLNPKGCFTWNCFLEGEDHQVELTFDWFTEQGAAIVDGVHYAVRKHGVWSGRWTLERDGQTHVSAHKESSFRRSFQIDGPLGPLALRAESAFCRTMRVERGGALIATIAPNHLFTRRSAVNTHDAEWDFPTLALVCWLTVMLWRRQASNSGGAAS